MSAPAYPTDIDAMTPAWISQALSTRFPGVQVADARITKRIDGTATKLRYALDYANESARAGAPPSLWIKSGFNAIGANQGEAFANEVNFFRDIAPLLPINKPDCYFGQIEPTTRNGVILLEDLINRGATFGEATHPLTPEQAAGVLSLQARYHAKFWGDANLCARFPWVKAGGAIAGAGMVDQFFGLWEPAMSRPRFDLVPAAQREKSRVQAALNRLMQDLRENPICFAHGDAHGANLYFDRDGAPGYLDWQHVMYGCWAFDTANFLITSLTIPDRRAHERPLLAHYRKELAANGVAVPSEDELFLTYRRYAMWPFMWVMLPDGVHPEPICMLNAERACTAIADLNTLEALEEF